MLVRELRLIFSEIKYFIFSQHFNEKPFMLSNAEHVMGENKTAKALQGKLKRTPPELRGWQKAAYILYFLLLFLVLISPLLALWPSSQAEEEVAPQVVELGPLPIRITEDVRFILIVAVMGALGGCAYSARSFAIHVARGTFDTRFTCWYILRPIIGSILAVVFYFAFHAAFLSFSASPDDLNVFGIATLGGIVGLFSKETLDKLKELFDRIIPTGQQDQGS